MFEKEQSSIQLVEQVLRESSNNCQYLQSLSLKKLRTILDATKICALEENDDDQIDVYQGLADLIKEKIQMKKKIYKIKKLTEHKKENEADSQLSQRVSYTLSEPSSERVQSYIEKHEQRSNQKSFANKKKQRGLRVNKKNLPSNKWKRYFGSICKFTSQYPYVAVFISMIAYSHCQSFFYN